LTTTLSSEAQVTRDGSDFLFYMTWQRVFFCTVSCRSNLHKEVQG